MGGAIYGFNEWGLMTQSDWVSYGEIGRALTAKWAGQLWLNELFVSFLICSKTLIFRGVPFLLIAQLQISVCLNF